MDEPQSNVVTLDGKHVPCANNRLELAAWLREVASWVEEGEGRYKYVESATIVLCGPRDNPLIKTNGPSGDTVYKIIGMLEAGKLQAWEDAWDG